MPTKDNSSSQQPINEFNNIPGVEPTSPANVQHSSRSFEKQPITEEEASSNALPTELWVKIFEEVMEGKINPQLREVCSEWLDVFSSASRELFKQQYQRREIGKSSNLPEVEYTLVEQPEGDFVIQPGMIYLKKNNEVISYTLLTPQKERVQGTLIATFETSTTLKEDMVKHEREILRELNFYINPTLMDVLQKREIDYLLALEEFILNRLETSSTNSNSHLSEALDYSDKAIILRLKGYLDRYFDRLRQLNVEAKRKDGYYFAVREHCLNQIRKNYRQYQEICYVQSWPNIPERSQADFAQLAVLMGESFWNNEVYYREREELLDKINAGVIQDGIIEAQARDEDQLELYCEHLTRVPSSVFTNPENEGFWQAVEEIGFTFGFVQDLPLEMNKCVSLKVLNLHENRFRKLPAVISELTSLQVLKLTWNHLQTLPQELAALTSLKELHLSYNLLQTVPSVIEKLTTLDELFLDFNFLREIPSWLSNQSLMEVGFAGAVRSSKASTQRLQKPFHVGWKVGELITTFFADSAEFHKIFEEIIWAKPAEWALLINPVEDLDEFPNYREGDDDLAPDERRDLIFPPKYSTPLHAILKSLAKNEFVPLSILKIIVAQAELDWNLPIVAKAEESDHEDEDEDEAFENDEFDNEAPEDLEPEDEELEEEESDNEYEDFKVDPFEVGKTPIAFFIDAASQENPAALAVLDDVLAKPTIDWDRLIQDERRVPFQGKALVHILLDALLGGSLPACEVLAGIANHAQLNWNAFKPLKNETPLYALVKAVFHREDIPQERKNRGLAILKKMATRKDLNWDAEFSSHEGEAVSTPRSLLLVAAQQGSREARNILEEISAKPEVSQSLIFSSSSTSHQAKRSRDALATSTEAEVIREEKSPDSKRAKPMS